ncbi:metalloregulator ArsR/SmtB family transcription factor [Filibacter tadaridae]|uniref:Cadmium resistance transcriptional regulatory protein CadC n=1 Tax=Filibacter tadaridae TaxID=2483811 RepID=A0A3P5WFF2_9BACL|nr:metalloregulator ArsR/SmtB family transcription factor [Filibacter tadaridae]VDC20015.1 Cadmium resistance transcriptional regulatory protein CadC [Filibacter tadaridae]
MTIKEVCEVTAVHDDIVDRVQKMMPDLGVVVQLFKALADETRLKIAYSLTLEEEMCVCDVAAVIGSSVATASHHLRYLRENALAKSQKKGKMVYYSLADNHIHQLVKVAYEHAMEGDRHGNG